MKHIILFFGLLFTTAAIAQQPAEATGGITFEHGTWASALAKAKKEKKMIMLDAYTSWCGPCKWMVKNVFPQKEVGEFYNKNFVSIKIDMEKGEGIELSKKFGVMAYPTYLFVSADGTVMHRSCGSCEGADFIKIGTDAMNPKARLAGLKKDFTAKPTDAETAGLYFDAAEKACMNIETDVKKYLDNLKSEQFLENGNYTLINKFINDYSHNSIVYLMDNYQKFAEKFGKKEVEEKVTDVYKNSLIEVIRAEDEKKMQEIQNVYRAQKNAPVDFLDTYCKMTWAGVKRDTVVYFQATIDFTEKYTMNDGSKLNSVAWDFYELTSNEVYLNKAVEFVRKSIELESGYPNNDTYACLLFKLGKYKEAKEVAEKAIEIGTKANANVQETELLLEKIKSKLKV
ncbi:MAG: thioredoxin family protein [Bacteroidia bacterium]|nr:thioredoxin family protein [Bacteroidia bacterium]